VAAGVSTSQRRSTSSRRRCACTPRATRGCLEVGAAVADELGTEETDGRLMAMPAYVGGSGTSHPSASRRSDGVRTPSSRPERGGRVPRRRRDRRRHVGRPSPTCRPSGSGRGASSARCPRSTPRSPAWSARTWSSAPSGSTRRGTIRDRSRLSHSRGTRARHRALAVVGPDLDLILSQNSMLQFSHRKTRARTLRLWPPHRGHRRQVPATAQSIGSVVSPG
jgi:hypothetical protein